MFDVALAGGRLRAGPSSAPVDDPVVLLRGGRIEAAGRRASIAISDRATRIDCTGRTIVAGFRNSHVHFFERKWADAREARGEDLAEQLQAFTRYGFTSVFDLSSDLENTLALRARIESGEIAGPRILTTGEGIVPPGALPCDDVLASMGVMKTQLPVVTSPDEAKSAVTRLLDRGADAVKLFASSTCGGALAGGAMEAAVAAARGRGKQVFVHPNTADDVRAALRAGADVVAHTTPRSPWDASLLESLAQRPCAITPTLHLWEHFLRHDRASRQRAVIDAAVDQLRRWRAAGGVVRFGTDWGAVAPDPLPEYRLMARAGMDGAAILASLTDAVVEAGSVADLVVLRGDPFEDVANFADVACTIRDGRIVYQVW